MSYSLLSIKDIRGVEINRSACGGEVREGTELEMRMKTNQHPSTPMTKNKKRGNLPQQLANKIPILNII